MFDKLKDLGIYADALIVIASDHGEGLIGDERGAEVTRTEEEWERLRSLGYVQ